VLDGPVQSGEVCAGLELANPSETSRSCQAGGAASKKSMAGDKISITAFAYGLVK
jgi:hypothetical protein